MKRKSKVFRFGEWQRTTNAKGREFYFYKGKPATADRWQAAAKRKFGAKKKRQPARKKKQKIEREKFDLCTLAHRQAFYERILEDRKKLRDTISEEEISALRVDIDIGDTKKKTKKGKMSGQGYRRFRDLRKLKNFLGLNVKYDNAPDFSRTKGICQYNKTAHLVVARMRGEREIGKRVLKRYIYKPV